MSPRFLLSLLVVTALRAAAPAAEDGRPKLLFSVKVTEEKLESLPDYMGPKNPVDDEADHVLEKYRRRRRW